MTTTELKEILANKLKAEGTYFTKSDITTRKTQTGFRITIKDYEHIPFSITLEEDDYFGLCVWVQIADSGQVVHFASSKKSYPIEEAVIYLGYYIGSRF